MNIQKLQTKHSIIYNAPHLTHCSKTFLLYLVFGFVLGKLLFHRSDTDTRKHIIKLKLTILFQIVSLLLCTGMYIHKNTRLMDQKTAFFCFVSMLIFLQRIDYIQSYQSTFLKKFLRINNHFVKTCEKFVILSLTFMNFIHQ